MEAAIVSGILKIAGEKLFSLLTSEFAAITGVKKDLEKLHGIHKEIEGFLSTICDLSIGKDPGFGWVFQLKDVAFDVDDLLYEIKLEAEKHKIARCSGKHAIADILSTKPKSYLYRFKVAQKIKAIRVNLASIAKQRRDMNAIRQNIAPSQPMFSRNRANKELSLLTNVEESEIPTRDREKVSVISKLLESNEGGHDWIVSIVGLGGSGKTTLAKHICNDNKIKEQFHDKIYWVHVSRESFNEENLIGKVFEAITKEKSDLHTLQHMIDEISTKLTSEKFLLVLDDAWHQDKADWNKFMVHLKGHAPESKLMLTTRDQKVAEAIKSDHNIFNLAYLSQVESWSLFLKNSGWKEEDMGSEFIQTGKEIVNKCGGVPLAIKTLGGILSEKREISTWEAIKQSDLWNVEHIEGRVFASLKLSYIHLTDHLKECFVFCSIFPKGYNINRKYLIEQWIANGLIKEMMDEKPEVIGSEYFDLLVKVSFLQDPRENWHGFGVEYKMHDLIHDLTSYILQSELRMSPPKSMTNCCTQKCRYLTVTSCGNKVEKILLKNIRALSLDKLIKKNPYICSVVLKYPSNTPFPLFILNLDYLRYLEIYNVSCTEVPEGISSCWNLQSLHFIMCHGFVELPRSIGKLKKLRNLELIGTDLESLPLSIGECRDLQLLQIRRCKEFREIPNTISKNENLRVLEIVDCLKLQQLPSEVTMIGGLECLTLEDCYYLVELPRGIGNLKRLEFLNIKNCRGLNWMPLGIAQLTRLKRLDLYVVGRGADDLRISDLENLNMLSGEMEIKNLPHFMNSSDAEKAYLKKKKNIQNLRLRWSENIMEEELALNLGVLDSLEPPSQIKNLWIDGYQGIYLPCWMSTQTEYSYLESAMINQTSQPRFICLIQLQLCSMPNLKHMQGILVLPSLKTLELVNMPNLEVMWTTTSGLGIGEEEVSEQYCFPILSRLIIYTCPKLIVEPYFPPSLEFMGLESCKGQLVPRGCSSFPLLTHTSHHPNVAGPSICSGSFVVAPHLNNTLELSHMIMLVSDWGFLQHLESLIIDCCCEGLTELPESMRSLSSLKMLKIRKCSNLMALPEWLGELRSLETITISYCPMMDNLPQSIGYLTSLICLKFWECANLKKFPDEIQHLTSLQELALERCKALTELPEGIGKLSALQRLSIFDCSALQSLPSSIQRLTALKQLVIWGCPELARRYKKEVGYDWHLVSHIRLVDIW